MPVFKVYDKSTISSLFAGWEETMIWSCLEDRMGTAYTDNPASPLSAQISIGCFCFFAGAPNSELILNKPSNLKSNFAIFVPQNRDWEEAIELHCKHKAKRRIRWATKKEADVFDKEKLEALVSRLPEEYELA